MPYYVYMLTNQRNGTLYVGVTRDIVRRVWQHKTAAVPGFTKEHQVDRLVWYETHQDVLVAIQREKRIKHWKREWKIHLIEEMNPYWRDLYDEIVG